LSRIDARIRLLSLALLACSVTAAKDTTPMDSPTPLTLSASDLHIATGQPSLQLFSSGSTHLPVWSLSGRTSGQSVAGLVGGLPGWCGAVKVEIVVTTTDGSTSPEFADVYRCHLSQLVGGAPFTEAYVLGTPVRTALPAGPFTTRTILLDPYYEVDPDAPLWVRIQREPDDPADTFTKPTGLAMVKVTPLPALPEAHVVQDVSGYNSWPMIQAIGDKLVCVYSRGKVHSIGDDERAVYARTSTDGGATWTAETVVANTPGYGEVEVGKGLDADGAMLLWVRRIGQDWNHDLYRSTDGVTFTKVTTPPLDPQPMQITDVFAAPEVGLMALWFAGNYQDDTSHAWGTVTSGDNGATWSQTVVEAGLSKDDWPTEPAAVYLGNGRILCVARTEAGGVYTTRAQFQIVSTDSGKTWTRARTNIGDVTCSTPSLILDAATGLLSNYYYQRGKGVLWRRVVDPDRVFDHPLDWPAPEPIAAGSRVTFDAGNANATAIGDKHYVAYYSGQAPDTAVMVAEAAAPVARE